MAQMDLGMGYRLTEHAQLEMERRHIRVQDVVQVLTAPEQVQSVRPGRVVYQSRIANEESPDQGPGRVYLLRVFVDVDRYPAAVVTVYRTSKVGKYLEE